MATTSDPIALGQTGLTLGDLSILVLKKVGAGGAATVESSSGITLVELGNGLYQLQGLQNPLPQERWSVAVALASSPASVLVTYRWGMTQADKPTVPDIVSNTPGGVQVTARPIVIAQGSQQPIAQALLFGLTADPTGTTAVMVMEPYGGGDAIPLTGVFAFIVTQYPAGAPSGQGFTWNMAVNFNWAAGDLIADNCPAGLYLLSATLTLPDSSTLVIPPNGNWKVRVVAAS